MWIELDKTRSLRHGIPQTILGITTEICRSLEDWESVTSPMIFLPHAAPEMRYYGLCSYT